MRKDGRWRSRPTRKPLIDSDVFTFFLLLAGGKLIVLLVPCICRSAHRPTFALLSEIKKCSVPDLLFNIIGQFQNQFLRLPCRCIVKARGDMHERCKPEGHAWPRLHIGCTYPYVPLVFFFRDMVKRQILADRAACLRETSELGDEPRRDGARARPR
jgi:hypothetical protein